MLSATIIATLAISLGPTAAVIGMADALFFRPLPVVAGQDRLLHYAFGTPMRDGFIPHQIVVRQPRGNRGRRDNCRWDRGAGIDLGWPGAGRCRASSRPRHGDHRQLLRRARRARDRRTSVPRRGRLGAGRRSGDGAERGTGASLLWCTRRRRRTRRPGEQRALHRHRRHASRLSRDERFPTVGILDSGHELPTREQRRAIWLGIRPQRRALPRLHRPDGRRRESRPDHRRTDGSDARAVSSGNWARTAPSRPSCRSCSRDWPLPPRSRRSRCTRCNSSGPSPDCSSCWA